MRLNAHGSHSPPTSVVWLLSLRTAWDRRKYTQCLVSVSARSVNGVSKVHHISDSHHSVEVLHFLMMLCRARIGSGWVESIDFLLQLFIHIRMSKQA